MMQRRNAHAHALRERLDAERLGEVLAQPRGGSAYRAPTSRDSPWGRVGVGCFVDSCTTCATRDVDREPSSDLDWNAYLGLLRIDGTLVILGVPDQAIVVSPFPRVVGRRSVAGSYMGSIKETQEMLEFCAEYAIAADIEIIGIDDVDADYERVLASDVRYRFVIDVDSSFRIVP